MSGSLTGWGGFPKGGSGGGGGFDPVAAAKALLAGAFNDPNFVAMLKSYAMTNSLNSYQNVTPAQLMAFIESSPGGTNAGITAMESLNPEDQVDATLNITGNNDDYNSNLQNAVATTATEVAATVASSTQSIRDWSLSVKDGTTDVYNYALGLWYDASAGNIKYLNGGSPSNLVSGDATGYMNGMVTSSSDTSACTEAFGADSWLSDELAYEGGSGSGGLSSGSNTTDCSSDSDCESDEACESGACVAKEDECSSNGDCASDKVCENGTCVAKEDECSSNGDCASDKVCENGTCVAKTTATTVSPVPISRTNATQTTSGPTLTVETDIASTCQFDKRSNFTYGTGTTFDVTGAVGHTFKLNSLANGSHTYYVICKDNATGGLSSLITITFTVDLSQDLDNAPTVENRTDAVFTTTTATLAVRTNTKSECRYNESGGFTFSAGTPFSTTGNYDHNASLTGLAAGRRTYYVVCKDIATGAASDTRKIDFDVNLAVEENAPEIRNITSATQTGDSPVLGITTDIPATCQYKQGGTFTYGGGSSLTASNDGYSHSISIAALTDGTYAFHVICKSRDNAATSEESIISTVLDRPETEDGEPEITNKTAGYQAKNNPTLAVTTDVAVTCQYKASSFTYGNGTAFTTTDGTSHSVDLSDIENGAYTYYVVCKNTATGVSNTDDFQVIFTVNVETVADTCAEMSSNDRQSDGDRSDSDTESDDTSYLWQAVENGKRGMFEKVDWFAGYQFSLNEDGSASELCAYFKKDEANKVYLFDGDYTELASAEVTGDGSWKCVDIDPVELSADTRYYLIARVNGQSINYEYKSNFLPVDTGKAVIEAGIRQTVDSTYNKSVVKYDYMIFGLVDVKISYTAESTKGPKITSTSPTGTIYSSSASVSVDAANDSTCRFGRDDVDYEDMDYTLQKVSNGTYGQLVCNLGNGDFTFYVRCADKNGQANDASAAVEFTVSD